MSDDVRAWVRRLPNGELVVTWQIRDGLTGDWRPGGTRPLTYPERLAWWATKRVPKVP